MKQIILPLILLITFFIPFRGQAQDTQTPNTTESLQGYVPPPMFSTPRPVPPKKVQPNVTKIPKISEPVDTTTKPSAAEEPYKIKKKISKPQEEPKNAAIPLKKPPHPSTKFESKPVVPKNEPFEKNKIESGLEPIDLLKKESKEKPKKTSSEGIVKGPKTMPSNKKQAVDTEILFKPDDKKPADLIDRIQKQTKEVKKSTPLSLPEHNFDLPSFKKLDDGRQKLNLIFLKSQKHLNDEQIYTLDKLIIPLLTKNKKARLQLVSYASPQKGILSGDRRIALSRAMAIRSHMMKQNISANRLDVRSLGAQTNIQPLDRVEIFLID